MIGNTVGPYRVVRKISQGGMGVVYEAIHDAIERRVAIKVLHADLSTNHEVVTRFFNEAKAVNRIDHPGIVQCHDFGHLADGTAFIVMEYLKGETLSRRNRRMHDRMPLSDIVRLVRQIAAALAAAHAKNIVHRDAYVISKVCFHVGHLRPQRRRNKPCPITVPAAARSALTSH